MAEKSIEIDIEDEEWVKDTPAKLPDHLKEYTLPDDKWFSPLRQQAMAQKRYHRAQNKASS